MQSQENNTSKPEKGEKLEPYTPLDQLRQDLCELNQQSFRDRLKKDPPGDHDTVRLPRKDDPFDSGIYIKHRYEDYITPETLPDYTQLSSDSIKMYEYIRVEAIRDIDTLKWLAARDGWNYNQALQELLTKSSIIEIGEEYLRAHLKSQNQVVIRRNMV